jgi:hypothetical protein
MGSDDENDGDGDDMPAEEEGHNWVFRVPDDVWH